jgi:hypothetical protein
LSGIAGRGLGYRDDNLPGKYSETDRLISAEVLAPLDPEYEILQKLGTDSAYWEYRHDQLWDVDGKALFGGEKAVKIYFYSVRINYNSE